ncbi:MAG: ATP-dependent DNA helicase [Thermoplasmata archaeon]|nr:ATP-dependent DNA helicase [Thermoplasmata archaeon]
MKFFPYEYRPYQKEIINDVEEALRKKEHVIIEAPTGIGKTIAVLGPSVEYAIENNLKIFYLTRTNSQQEQVVKEARKLREKYNFILAPIQGRNTFCLLALKDKLIDATPEELALTCSKRRRDFEMGDMNSCPYYKNFLEKGNEIVIYAEENILTAQDFVERSLEDDVCAYEAMKSLSFDANVLLMPYIYFFDPFIRPRLLSWTNTTLDNIILIIDEAHNLPDFARSQRSIQLTVKSLSYVDKETRDFGDDNKFGIKYSEFVEILRENLNIISENFLKEKDDMPISKKYLLDILLNEFNVSEDVLMMFLNTMVDYGDNVRKEKLLKNQIPRSFIGNLGSFLLEFFMNDEKDVARIISKEDQLKIEMFAIDPKPVTSIIENVYSSIHMSGTLKPLDEYESIIFNEKKARKISYPSPFPKNNLKVYYIDNVTTKYDDIKKIDEIEKMANTIGKIVNLGYNSLILFPSYTLMEKVLNQDIGFFGNFYKETPNITQKDFIRSLHLFKRHGGAFFSVFGSRISEGIDFPNGQIQLVLIAGIPYPKPTAKHKLMELYYSQEIGKEKVYRYLVHGPTGRKMVQAIGRMIRSSTDRGVAIILDKRAPRFRDYIDMEKSEDIEHEIRSFFNMASLK